MFQRIEADVAKFRKIFGVDLLDNFFNDKQVFRAGGNILFAIAVGVCYP